MKDSKWPLIIGGMLAIHVLACVFFVYLATSNDSFAVEEGYYEKALQWDQRRAREAASDRLGWRLELSVAGPLDAGVPTRLECRLRDRDGVEVSGAAMVVEAFPIARSGAILHADLTEASPGVYAAALPMNRGGRWELRLTASRGGERFTRTMILFVDETVGARADS